MKTQIQNILVAALVFSAGIAGAGPLGTAFTYQGRLASGGQAANGIYDFRIAIYDAAANGNAIGGPLTNAAVSVADGLFTTTLDFGAGVFTGDARWLEIAVRTNGSAGDYHILTPRQPLTPAPYALWASRAGGVADGAITTASLASNAITGDKIANGTIPLADLAQSGATNGQVIKWSAAANAWMAGPNAGGSTALLSYMDNGPFTSAPLASGNNAIAQGEHAQALGNDSVVGGGLDNVASQWFTTVGGGWSNIASGFLFGRTTISGGEWNQAQGDWSTVGGGQLNTAGGPLWGRATVAGGWQNNASGDMSAIGGGSQNSALMGHAVIGGGQANVISNGAYATISGGSQNLAVAGHGVIGGGQSNSITTLQAPWAAIGGGHVNQVSGMAATVGGGYQNIASATGGVVGGGERNAASGPDAFVGGGYQNTASATGGVVGGGERNAASGIDAFVGGGNGNVANGRAATVGGGDLNAATSLHSVVGGGNQNKTFGDASTVGGGNVNAASGAAATVPGGFNNRANGDYSFAAGQSAVAAFAGSVVFADSQYGDFVSTVADEFAIRANNGVRVQTPVGIHLDALNCPLIVRDWDPFSSTAAYGKANIGRWGVFMEPYALVIGIPNKDVGSRWMEVARYNPDGTREKVFGVGNDGVTTVKVLNLTGGSDLAEPFEVSGHQRIPKGAVMVIDDQNPGQLRLSDQPYDKRVAGVVSGAAGLNAGLTISQEGVTDKGTPVALSGRVYTLADASYGPIRPGDQLTTSPAPGHAMKVSDSQKAQGAILGKAMTALKKGRGLVLVLVSLQ